MGWWGHSDWSLHQHCTLYARVGEEAGVEGLLGQGVVGGVVGTGHHVQGAGRGQLHVSSSGRVRGLD